MTDAENTTARIMIVDDNPEFLAGLKLTLEMENYTVISAADGQQALDILEDALAMRKGISPLPDLILVDIMMPVMDGYVFYERVRSNPYTNHIPMIFLTAKDSGGDIQHGKGLGIEDYLTKLASTDEILASIRGKLARIERRRALLEQTVTTGKNTSTETMSSRQRNLLIMIAVFVVLLIIFGWGLASIMGLL